MADLAVQGVVVRVLRVTAEVAYVNVPITELMVSKVGDSASGTLDAARLRDEALRIARLPSTVWQLENAPSIDVHPVQRPRE